MIQLSKKEQLFRKLERRFIYIEGMSITQIQDFYDYLDRYVLDIKHEVREGFLTPTYQGDTSFPDWYDESKLDEYVQGDSWANTMVNKAREMQNSIVEYINETARFTNQQKNLFSFVDKTELAVRSKIKSYIKNHNKAGIKSKNKEIGLELLLIAHSKGVHNRSNASNADCYKELQERVDAPSIQAMNTWLNNFRDHFSTF